MGAAHHATTAPLSGEEDALLRAFARVVLTVPRALDADLLSEQGMSSSEYLTLMHLSEAPQQRLRMSDLAGAAALSLSGMTRIIHRLAATGLVQRKRSCEDGRGWYAVLTDAGLARLEKAWPDHLTSTRRHFFDHLEGVSVSALTAVFERMANETDGSAGVPALGALVVTGETVALSA